MSVFHRFNKWLKQNQALLNFFGFIAVIITIILTYYQFDISNTRYEDESIPNMSVSILNNDSDVYKDSLIFKNLNSNHNLINVTIYLLDKDKLRNFESSNIEFSTRKLKNLIRNVATSYISDYDYSVGDMVLLKHKSDIYSSPLIFEFSYLEKNQQKRFYLLYQYDYEIYFGNDEWKVRTKKLSYKQSLNIPIDNKDNSIKNILVRYNLKRDLFISKSLQYLLILNIYKNDIEFKPLYSLYKINDSLMRVHQNISIVAGKDTTKYVIKYLTPEFIENDTLKFQRNLLLKRILNNKSNYSGDLKNHLIKMEGSLKFLKGIDWEYFKKELKVKNEPLPRWREMNDSMLTLSFKHYNLEDDLID